MSLYNITNETGILVYQVDLPFTSFTETAMFLGLAVLLLWFVLWLFTKFMTMFARRIT